MRIATVGERARRQVATGGCPHPARGASGAGALGSAALLHHQRTAGNRAVGRLSQRAPDDLPEWPGPGATVDEARRAAAALEAQAKAAAANGGFVPSWAVDEASQAGWRAVQGADLAPQEMELLREVVASACSKTGNALTEDRHFRRSRGRRRHLPSTVAVQDLEGDGDETPRKEICMTEPQQGSGRSERSVRLIFSYDGDDVRLESRQPVEMVVPPSDPVDAFENQPGFWTELRDAQGSVLHRRVMHDPIRRDAEVFSPDPERSIARVPLERPRGAFVVLVPLVPEADHVALMGAPAAGTAAFAPAVELHRVSLTGKESS